MSAQRISAVLDPRSIIVGAVILLVGAGIGFGVGYVYAPDSSTKTAGVSGAKAQQTQKPAAKKPAAALSAQKREKLLSCLASHGVRYPAPATADFNSPPPGVDKAKFTTEISACYAALIKSG